MLAAKSAEDDQNGSKSDLEAFLKGKTAAIFRRAVLESIELVTPISNFN
jgi:hypothetical protein